MNTYPTLSTAPQLPGFRHCLCKPILFLAFWCWTGRGICRRKSFKLNWTTIVIIFKSEQAPILYLNMGINISLFPAVYVRVLHLSPVFRKIFFCFSTTLVFPISSYTFYSWEIHGHIFECIYSFCNGQFFRSGLILAISKWKKCSVLRSIWILRKWRDL